LQNGKIMNNPSLSSANAHFVTEFLAVGGDLHYDRERASEQAFELVEVGGITHVLDVRLEAVEPLWEHFPQVNYQWDGIDDAGQKVPGSWFDHITTWASDAIDAGGVVLTHCHMGINRGPSAGFAVLLRRGWDPIDALDAVRDARSIAVIAYAEDALEWHLERTETSATERRSTRNHVAKWRAANPLDQVRTIRAVRNRENGWVA
jgi:dual specificity phosphatase 3